MLTTSPPPADIFEGRTVDPCCRTTSTKSNTPFVGNPLDRGALQRGSGRASGRRSRRCSTSGPAKPLPPTSVEQLKWHQAAARSTKSWSAWATRCATGLRTWRTPIIGPRGLGAVGRETDMCVAARPGSCATAQSRATCVVPTEESRRDHTVMSCTVPEAKECRTSTSRG